MAILYTIDSLSVDREEFKSRIRETGYFELPQEEKTWTHIAAVRQIIMVKTMLSNDGCLHTFRIAIDT